MRVISKILLSVFILLLVAGCFKSLNPLYEPSRNMVKLIIPEYKKYVLDDEDLTADEKSYRINNAQAYEILVREYE